MIIHKVANRQNFSISISLLELQQYMLELGIGYSTVVIKLIK